MIGDLLLIGEKHEKATAEILKKLEGVTLKNYVIAVGGESGTGKSEIAYLLRMAFKKRGIRSKIIHTDNYYKTKPDERTEWRQSNGIKESVGLNEYNWELINRHILDFRNKTAEVTLPFLDIVTEQEDRLTTSFKYIDVLVLEGLYAVNAEADFRVLIDMTYHDTKDAQKLRGKEPQNQYRAQVLEAEHASVRSIRGKADLLISKKIMGLD
ncbi:MAG: uridine kinase [bacterium]